MLYIIDYKITFYSLLFLHGKSNLHVKCGVGLVHHSFFEYDISCMSLSRGFIELKLAYLPMIENKTLVKDT